MGMGRIFIINRETLIIAIRLRMLISPSLKPAVKPSFTVEPSISVTLKGPETALSKSIPLNKRVKLFRVAPIEVNVSVNHFCKER